MAKVLSLNIVSTRYQLNNPLFNEPVEAVSTLALYQCLNLKLGLLVHHLYQVRFVVGQILLEQEILIGGCLR